MNSLDVMVAREEEFNDNLNLRANFRGCTALHYAALADDAVTVTLLLEAGADPLKTNDYGTYISVVFKLQVQAFQAKLELVLVQLFQFSMSLKSLNFELGSARQGISV